MSLFRLFGLLPSEKPAKKKGAAKAVSVHVEPDKVAKRSTDRWGGKISPLPYSCAFAHEMAVHWELAQAGKQAEDIAREMRQSESYVRRSLATWPKYRRVPIRTDGRNAIAPEDFNERCLGECDFVEHTWHPADFQAETGLKYSPKKFIVYWVKNGRVCIASGVITARKRPDCGHVSGFISTSKPATARLSISHR
jgi:hypothetical protein